MKKILLLLSVVVMVSSCGASRRVSTDVNTSWIGYSTQDILFVMGDPDRIEDDGKGGSVIKYETKPDYENPSYDILAPDAKPSMSGYAYFYLDRAGDCYWVDTDRKLPEPRYANGEYEDKEKTNLLVDILMSLPLLLIGLLL